MSSSGALDELESIRAGPGTQAGRILLVGRPGDERERLRLELTDRGWTIDTADTLHAAQLRLADRGYRAIVADLARYSAEPRDTEFSRAWQALTLAARRAGIPLLAVDPNREEPPDPGPDTGPDAASGRWETQPERRAAAVDGLAEEFVAGRSPAMQYVMEQVRLVAPKDTTVLITGETGTGKERVSRAIHALSRRNRAPMVSVNCAGIPATLLEDEFFGHVKGAFTDAHRMRIGRFEQARGGTLLLDEIGELPLELQPKLLRALQEREIHRVGGLEPVRLDIRVIAATNVDLWRRVEEKRFREDLFYRINVFHIELPPLRDRPEDIPLFAAYFLARFSRREGQPPKYLSRGAERALLSPAVAGQHPGTGKCHRNRGDPVGNTAGDHGAGCRGKPPGARFAGSARAGRRHGTGLQDAGAAL